MLLGVFIMAIYHFQNKIVSRGKNQSATSKVLIIAQVRFMITKKKTIKITQINNVTIVKFYYLKMQV